MQVAHTAYGTFDAVQGVFSALLTHLRRTVRKFVHVYLQPTQRKRTVIA